MFIATVHILQANSHFLLNLLIASSLFYSLEPMFLLNNLKIDFLFCTETRSFSAAYISRLILFVEVKAVYF